jgi:putative ABC transport system permease protein
LARFLWSQLRFRRSRAAALATAVFVAAVGFTLLTGSAQTSQLRLRGSLKSTFRPAYDILVRPSASETALERREGLVRPNFLSGIYGGISLEQWHQIERMRGVAVAAPIANIGFVFPFEKLPVPLNDVVTGAAHQLYRIDATWLADGGLSRYPQGENYVYYSPRDRFVQAGPTSSFLERGPDTKPVASCDGFNATTPRVPAGPFPSAASQASLACFPSARGAGGETVNSFNPASPRFVGAAVTSYFPIYISAIDPVQEAKLLHLDRAVVSGRYLREQEALLRQPSGSFARLLVPVLASNRSYIDERLELSIRRLDIPPGADLPRVLATSKARRFATRLTGPVVARKSIPVGAFYRRVLTTSPQPSWPVGTLFDQSYWTTGPTRYRRLGPETLAPLPVQNSQQIWRSQFSGWYTPPRDNLDPQFRRLHERVASNAIVNGVARFHPLQIVGHFDPAKLPGFSALTRVPLETYYPPSLAPGNAAAQQALKGRPLGPSQNLGGYVQPPPLLLTTMGALRSFLDPRDWSPGFSSQGSLTKGINASAIPLAQRRAPISTIRVKVAGVTGPDPLSLERIKVVAQLIHRDTGLAVDITAGSSPHPVEIALPKGRFGRPALLLREGWSKKGVTVNFLRALDRKDLALYALVLVICGFFLGNGALASVRARRAEIGTLLTLGWTRRAIFRAVLGELAAVGVIAGAAGMGLAALLVEAFSLRLPLLRVLLVLPIAVVLALAAGALPAWLAARGLPMDALRPPVTARRRGRPVRRLSALALVNLTRLPARTLVAASGLAIGVAALAVLVGIEQAFQGTLVGTLLGNAVSLQVRGADFAAVGLTIALAALSVADVIYLNLRERQAELVTLRTLGWSNRHVRTTVLLESLGLGLLGSLGGAVLALLVGGLVLGIPIASLVLAALAAAGGGIAAALVASLVPIGQVGRLTVPGVLAAE